MTPRPAGAYRGARRNIARAAGVIHELRVVRKHQHDRLTMKSIMRANFRKNALGRWDGKPA